jgi:hypothetical protein
MAKRPLDEAIAQSVDAARRQRTDDMRWLLEPPEERMAHIHIELTEQAEVSQEIRAAIEALALQLGARELAARKIKECSPYKDCVKFKYSQCYAFVSCKIKEEIV